ncbi:MAG: PIG-L family deacetylase [Thermodesulfobacteriota bacterium]
MNNIAVFLFAHQDDEFGVYAEMDRLIATGVRIVAIYLTSGNLNGQPCQERDNESLAVLADMGVMRDDIYFLGKELHIPDGRLYEHLDRVYQATAHLLNSFTEPVILYFLAWEGGHQDHDAVHLIGLALGENFGVLNQSFQFPLYTGNKLPWIFFKLFSPISSNGAVISFKISWRSRLRFIKYILSYKSQVSTWIYLLPFVFLHYIFRGTQLFQSVDIHRVLRSPHSGKLLYERRGVASYHKFYIEVEPFINSNLFQTNQD